MPTEKQNRTDLSLVTAASSNHFRCLVRLIKSVQRFEPGVPLFVYDLGLDPAEVGTISTMPNIFFRRFEFARHPRWMHFTNCGGKARRCGFFAWKAQIVYEVFQQKKLPTLWLDAGNLLMAPLSQIRQILFEQGIYSPLSSGIVAKWTHPGVLRTLHTPMRFVRKRNRNAACVGLNPAMPAAWAIATEWARLSLDRNCIAPAGATIKNHRFDQAVLTVLIYQFQEIFNFELTDTLKDISTHNDTRKRNRQILGSIITETSTPHCKNQ